MLRGFFLTLVFLLNSLSLLHAGAYRVPLEASVYSGASAVAGGVKDASASFYNPAALTLLDAEQIVLVNSGIVAGTEFTGTSFGETGTAKSTANAIIPAFHYANPISEDIVFGFSATMPWGGGISFPKDSIARTTVTNSLLYTPNFSPALGYQLTDKFSIGAGIDFQLFFTEINNVVEAGPLQGKFSNSAFSWSVSWHGGVLYQFTERTRLGLAYRAPMRHLAEGSSTFQQLVGDEELESHDYQVRFDFPAVSTANLYHELNDKWALSTTVEYTQWSIVDELTLEGTALPVPDGDLPSGELDFKDTFRVNGAVYYWIRKNLRMVTVVGYDQTPTKEEHRQLALPESDIVVFNIGFGYYASKALRVDIGYAHPFFSEAKVNNVNVIVPPIEIATVGTGQIRAEVFSLQLTWNVS